TFRDHWYAENPRTVYYRDAANLYLNDARDLITASQADLDKAKQDARLADLTNAREMLKSPPMDVVALKSIHWTSATGIDLRYSLQARKATLPGSRVWGRKRDKPLRLAEGKDTDRQVVEEFAREPVQLQVDTTIKLKNDSLDRDEAKPPVRPTLE